MREIAQLCGGAFVGSRIVRKNGNEALRRVPFFVPPSHRRHPNQARNWIIRTSLVLTTCVFAFLVVAPTIGYPLDPGANHVIRLLQILTPVFVGYLGSAAHFVFGDNTSATDVQKPLSPNAVLMIKGLCWRGWSWHGDSS